MSLTTCPKCRHRAIAAFAIILLCLCSIVAIAGATWAAYLEYPIEEWARAISEQNMRNKHVFVKGSVVDAKSWSSGSCVYNEITMKPLRPFTPANKYAELDKMLRGSVHASVCTSNRNDPYFNSGLYYHYIYKDTKGKVLSDFVVTRDSCKNNQGATNNNGKLSCVDFCSVISGVCLESCKESHGNECLPQCMSQTEDCLKTCK